MPRHRLSAPGGPNDDGLPPGRVDPPGGGLVVAPGADHEGGLGLGGGQGLAVAGADYDL